MAGSPLTLGKWTGPGNEAHFAGSFDEVQVSSGVRSNAWVEAQRLSQGDTLIQYGSRDVEEHALRQGYTEIFERTGVQVIPPGCGACIGCGPGVSADVEQVTVSAINRNYKGRSGPGRLYLASPLTVATSAVLGRIASYEAGLFEREPTMAS